MCKLKSKRYLTSIGNVRNCLVLKRKNFGSAGMCKLMVCTIENAMNEWKDKREREWKSVKRNYGWKKKKLSNTYHYILMVGSIRSIACFSLISCVNIHSFIHWHIIWLTLTHTHAYTERITAIMRFQKQKQQLFSASAPKKNPRNWIYRNRFPHKINTLLCIWIAFNVTCNAMSWKYSVARSCVCVCVYTKNPHTWTFTHARTNNHLQPHTRTHAHVHKYSSCWCCCYRLCELCT